MTGLKARDQDKTMTWIILIEWLARLILVFLIFLSVWSIKIILDKKQRLKLLVSQKGQRQRWFQKLLSADAKNLNLALFDEEEEGANAHLLQSLKSIFEQERREDILLSLSSLNQNERNALEDKLSLLGTLGSTTPFIGLLGTVLGIIVAFGELSQGSTDSLKVMYALAEALVLTAVGLGVAIPAVIAFNYFSKQISSYFKECEVIQNQLLSKLKKN